MCYLAEIEAYNGFCLKEHAYGRIVAPACAEIRRFLRFLLQRRRLSTRDTFIDGLSRLTSAAIELRLQFPGPRLISFSKRIKGVCSRRASRCCT